MRRFCYFFFFLLSLFFVVQNILGQDLPEKWKKWLNEEVIYIITPKEKEVFLTLKSEREREAFETAFWLQRDPTPGTPANEFKEEHYRRLRYADEFLGRGSSQPGWKTDRGKIYIILGKPVDVQRFYESAYNLVPCELWNYQGDTSLGLPPFFYIIFYQDAGSSEYKLYSPSFDGPQRLLEHTQQATNYSRNQAYQQIKGASPELAEASLTYIPGTGEDSTSSISSLSSDLLISQIQNLPVKRGQKEWAEAFARAKEIITEDYSVNYVPCNSVLFVHQENQKNYVHAIIEPNQLSMSHYEQKDIAPVKLNVVVSDSSGNIIHQEEKNVPIEVSHKDFEKIQRRISAIGDVIPIVEGNFSIRLLLRNLESKEFSSLDEKVSSPTPGKPSLSPLLLLYGEKEVPHAADTIPFLLSGHQLYPNSQKVYTTNEALIFYSEIYNPSAELNACTFSFTISQDEKILTTQRESVQNQAYFLERFPLKGFKAGYYELRVSVVNTNGKEILSSGSEFAVVPLTVIPRPWNFNRIYPPLDHPYFSIIRATEYLGLGQNDMVIKELEKFYSPSNPQKDIALRLANAYFNKRDFPKVVTILDPLKEVQDLEIDKLLGRAYLETLNYAKAVEFFTKALAAGGEIVEILNMLGYSCFKNGDLENARKYLARSLRVNPDQPEIKRLIEKI
jgi:GWxTD domain-containing protein